MRLNSLTRLVQQCDTRWQRLREPDARRVLISVRAPMNYVVMAPIFERMKSDPRLTFFISASHGSSQLTRIHREVEGKIQVIHPSRALMMKFDACLAADFIWMTLPRGTRRVQMFHGVAGKYSNVYDTPDRSARCWDRLFFINRRRLQNFVSAGAIDADSPAARLVGMPKVDCLVDGSMTQKRALEMLGIDPGRKVVLYAPTWSPYSSLISMGEELVKALISAGYAVIVKLHDRSHDPEYDHSGGVNWARRLGALVDKAGGHLATGSNSCPYMMAADVLITDHSSVGFEYLLLGRPVVRIEMPELLKQANVNLEYVSLLSSVAITVQQPSQAIDAVDLSLTQPFLHSEARQAIGAELFYQAGTATDRAVLELYDVLELDPP